LAVYVSVIRWIFLNLFCAWVALNTDDSITVSPKLYGKYHLG
jgi:hypothetical protein